LSTFSKKVDKEAIYDCLCSFFFFVDVTKKKERTKKKHRSGIHKIKTQRADAKSKITFSSIFARSIFFYLLKKPSIFATIPRKSLTLA